MSSALSPSSSFSSSSSSLTLVSSNAATNPYSWVSTDTGLHRNSDPFALSVRGACDSGGVSVASELAYDDIDLINSSLPPPPPPPPPIPTRRPPTPTPTSTHISQSSYYIECFGTDYGLRTTDYGK